MLAIISPPATVTPIRRQVSTIAEDRRAAAIVQLAHDVADANDAGLKTGLPLQLWETDHTMLAGLLPHLDPSDARSTLIEATDWVVQSRADGLSDNEIEDFIESARQEARAAVLADTLVAASAA